MVLKVLADARQIKGNLDAMPFQFFCCANA